ncbi:MAG TPA: hypothetical protein VF486_11695 [Actinomycetes bacterium]
MTPPVAHHLGEESLAPLLLLGGGWLSVVLTVGRDRLAAGRDRLLRRPRRGPATRTGEETPTRTG